MNHLFQRHTQSRSHTTLRAFIFMSAFTFALISCQMGSALNGLDSTVYPSGNEQAGQFNSNESEIDLSKETQSQDQVNIQNQLLDLINRYRLSGYQCGFDPLLPAEPLTLNDTLSEVALYHAMDMAIAGYVGDESPSGETTYIRLASAGFRASTSASVIAVDQSNAQSCFEYWLASQDACDVLLSDRFLQVGIARYQSQQAKHSSYWVVVLGTR